MPDKDILQLLGEPENAPIKESQDVDLTSILGEPENAPPEKDVFKESEYIKGIYNEVVKDIDKEEYKPAYKQAIIDLEKKYQGMGGMTPIGKMQEFNTRMEDFASKASDSFLTENVDEETFNTYKKSVMDEAEKIADELALNINDKGQVQPFEDENERYANDLSNSLLRTRNDIDEENAAGFWESLKNKVRSGTYSLYGSSMDLIGTVTGLNYFDTFKEAGEGQKFYADYFRELPSKYDGTVQKNLEDGDLVGAGAATALAVGEAIPRMLPAFANPIYGTVIISAEAGLDKYRELEDKDMPKWEKIYNATLTGLNEYVWERAITVPILNRSRQAISRLGKDQAQTVIQKTVKNSLERNLNKVGGVMPQWMQEGLSEVATGVSNDIVDKVTSDPSTKIGSHVIDDFVVGAAMGKLFSLPQDIVRTVEKARPLIESVLDKIPSSTSIGEKVEVVPLMAERDALIEEEANLDPAYKGKNTARIEELDTEINNIVESKTKKDEVQTRDGAKPIEDRTSERRERDRKEVKDTPEAGKDVVKKDELLVEEGGAEKAPPSVLKEMTDEALGKRAVEIETSRIPVEKAEFSAIEKEMDSREWNSVFGIPLEKVDKRIGELEAIEKEMPYGFGTFIEKWDMRKTRAVVDKYLNPKNISNNELIKDFKDALMGSPTNSYSDGLKLREATKEAGKRGVFIKDLLEKAKQDYTSEGYTDQTAEDVVTSMMEPVFTKGKVETKKETAPIITLKEAAETEKIEKPKVKKVKEFSKEEQDVISADNRIVDAAKTYDLLKDKKKLSKDDKVKLENANKVLDDSAIEVDKTKDVTVVSKDGKVLKTKSIPIPSEGKHKSDYDIDTQAVIDKIISNPAVDMIEMSDKPRNLEEAIKAVKEGRVGKESDKLLNSIDQIVNDDGAVMFASKDQRGNKKFVELKDITGEVLPAEAFTSVDIVTQTSKEKPTKNEVLSKAEESKVKLKTGEVKAEKKVVEKDTKVEVADKTLFGKDIDITKKGANEAIEKTMKEKAEELSKDDYKKGKDAVWGKIVNRRKDLNLATLETNIYTNAIDRAFKKPEREAITFLLEGKGIPESLKGSNIDKLYNNPTPEMKEAVKNIRARYDKTWKFITENTDKMSADQIEDYVTHLWDIPNKKKADVVKWFATKNRFLKKRYIDSLKEGMDKFGLKPLTTDISEILRVYESMVTNVVENQKFVNDLKEASVQGVPLLVKQSDAPSNWKEIDHPALNYPVYRKQGDVTVKEFAKYRVNPKAHSAINVVLGTGIISDARVENIMRGYEAIGGFLKKINLSASLFHHGALTETGMALMGPAKLTKTLLKDIAWAAATGKGTPAFANPEAARDAVSHLVQLGATNDMPIKAIQGTLTKLAKLAEGTPVAKQITKILEVSNEKWDKVLWEYLHDGLKVYGFEHIAEKVRNRSIKDNWSTEKTDKALDEVGQLVNDTFGGQNWDVLMVSPMQQRILRWSLLSSDWTVSTVRQALSPMGVGRLYKNESFWKSVGVSGSPVNIRAKYGTAFWIKAGLYYGVGSNLLNALFRKWDEEENPELYEMRSEIKGGENDVEKYSMFGNAPGHSTHLFYGRSEDGHELYLRHGKQFRELPEIFVDDEGFHFPTPLLKKLGGKTNPLLQIGTQIMTGSSPSGYENWELKDKKGWERDLGILKTIASSPVPYAFASLVKGDKDWSMINLIFPKSRGMSKRSVVELFKKGMEFDEGEFKFDEAFLQEIYIGAVMNKLPASELLESAIRGEEAANTVALRDGARTIEEAKESRKNAGNRKERAKIDVFIKKLKDEEKERKKAARKFKEAFKKLDKKKKDYNR